MLWWTIRKLKSSDKSKRVKAVRKLTSIKDARTTDLLIGTLNDSVSDIRILATRALGTIGDVRAINPLVLALNDEHIRVREEALKSLAQFDSNRARELLIAALSSKFEDVQLLAANILEMRGWKPQVEQKQQEEERNRIEGERRREKEEEIERQRQELKRKAEEQKRKFSNQQNQIERKPEMSSHPQFQACPNCKNMSSSSVFADDSGLNIFHCDCGKVYCDNCSGGGLISLPTCPESPYHTGRTKIGIVPPQARKEQPKENKTKGLAGELHYAAQQGDVQKVQKILDQGVNPDSPRDGSEVVAYARTITPLYSAAEHGHKIVVELLLKRGANVNSQCGISRTPLYMAVLRGHIEVARLLLANGANVNTRAADDFTPLGRALDKGFHELVTLLQQYGGRE